MLEPSLAFQTAVRSALIAAPAVTDLVAATSIRSGSTRPDNMPCVILTGASTEFLGCAAGSQLLARVTLDLHIWAIEDGADTGRAIGFAVARTLLGLSVQHNGFEIDQLDQPALAWLRDPKPERAYTHGILGLEAVIRWRQ